MARRKKSSPKNALNRRTLYRKSQKIPISSPKLLSPIQLGLALSRAPGPWSAAPHVCMPRYQTANKKDDRLHFHRLAHTRRGAPDAAKMACRALTGRMFNGQTVRPAPLHALGRPDFGGRGCVSLLTNLDTWHSKHFRDIGHLLINPPTKYGSAAPQSRADCHAQRSAAQQRRPAAEHSRAAQVKCAYYPEQKFAQQELLDPFKIGMLDGPGHPGSEAPLWVSVSNIVIMVRMSRVKEPNAERVPFLVCLARAEKKQQRVWDDLERQVRKTPCRPEVGLASAFHRCIPTGMHGPTCIFWANLIPFSRQYDMGLMQNQSRSGLGSWQHRR
jgi:hypothetical protein